MLEEKGEIIMTLTLEQLQSAFKKADTDGNNLPNNYYPFFLMKEGESAKVRFLPDADADNPLGFLVEKLMHNLEINGERKSVACLTMYDKECPICKVSSEYYKKEDKENGKKYWRKKQYIAQALVLEDPLDADETTGETHVGKVRFLTLGFQLYTVVKEAFENNELNEVPYAFKDGCDFIIKKTKQGDYPNYAMGSRFVRQESDLTDEQLAVVEESLGVLSELLPKDPGEEKVQGMLSAALTGSAFEDDNDSSSTSKENQSESSDSNSDSDGDDEADAILEQIRARRAKQNS